MKSIAVFSIKGGVGKSTAAVNLAYASATMGGRRTLLWDLDAQGAATYLLRLNAQKGVKARKVLAGEDDLTPLIQLSDYPLLDVLPADKSLRYLEGDLAQDDRQKRLKKLLKGLREDYDRIILDCPPGLSELSARIFKAVDLIVLPIIPSPLSERAWLQLQDEVQRVAGPPILPVWSMADLRRKLHKDTVSGQPYWPHIPYAAVIEAMATEQAPVAAFSGQSAASRSFGQLWARIEEALAKH